MIKIGKGREIFMDLYLYVIAAAMAVLAILFFYKMNVEKIKETPEKVGKAHTNFFMGAAMSEAIPIILIIFAYTSIEPVQAVEGLIIPGIFIVLIMLFSVFFIFLQRSVGVPEESKSAVNQFSMIAIAMANAVPIVAIVFLFLSLA